ncbi:MAG: thermonuclease family protein [Gammaproteobacteria bacterium]
MPNKSCRFLAMTIAMIAGAVHSEIFYWNDADGRTHYSDRAKNGAHRIRIDPGVSRYRVVKVFDGDTLLLENREKVRLLGINAPEVENRFKRGEAGGEEAKRLLEKLLAGKKVRLETDVEKKDRYGRTLAHVFTDEKIHVNLALVENGMAFVTIHPPNLKYADVLLTEERRAESKARGIWAYPEYAAQDISEMSRKGTVSWRRLRSRVTGIRQGRRYVYLTLSRNFEIRIERSQTALFPPLKRYVGKRVEVRGWPSRSKNRYSIPVRHPSALRILD